MNAWSCSKCSYKHKFNGTRCAMCSSLRVTTTQMRNFIAGKKNNTDTDNTHSGDDDTLSINVRNNNNKNNHNKNADGNRNSCNTNDTGVSVGINAGRNVNGHDGNNRNDSRTGASTSIAIANDNKKDKQSNFISLVDNKDNGGNSPPQSSNDNSNNVNISKNQQRQQKRANQQNHNIRVATATATATATAMNRRIINPYLKKSSSIVNNNNSGNINTSQKRIHENTNAILQNNRTSVNSQDRNRDVNRPQNENKEWQEQQHLNRYNSNQAQDPLNMRRRTQVVHNPYLKQTNKDNDQYQNQQLKQKYAQKQQQPQHHTIQQSKKSSANQNSSSVLSSANANVNVDENENANSRPNSSTSVVTSHSAIESSSFIDNQQTFLERETDPQNFRQQYNLPPPEKRPTTSKRTRQQKINLTPTNSHTNMGTASSAQLRPKSLHVFAQERNVPLRNYQPGPIKLETGNNVHRTWIYPVSEKYSEREYQLEISRSAVLQNTLVSLPTGLGKTLIAAVVMYNFYRWFPSGKVIFLAPTRPLVTQQIEACYNIMGIPELDTAEMSGKTKQDHRRQLWTERRLFFCTPQTFQKDIEDGRCDAKNVVCVVVDEAHKAMGKYAYVQVIDLIEKAGGKFRVLGLSATPGKDIKDICEVVKALRISKIEARLDSDPDVEKYTFHKEFEYIIVEPTDEIQVVSSLFGKILDPLLDQLRNRGGLRFFRGGNATLTTYNHHECWKSNRDQSLYTLFAVTGVLLRVREALRESGVGVARKRLRTFMSKVGDKTDKLSKNPHCKKLVQSDAFKNFFSAVVDTQDLGGEAPPTPVQLKMNNPKLSKLEEILKEHFERCRAVGVDSRVIVFSQLRDSVEEIVHVLKYSEPLIRPNQFVGQGAGSSGPTDEGNTIKRSGKKIAGMNQKEQQKVIKKFKNNAKNVLVCTSIGEEGLDIGEVDLIVNYDCLRSSTRMTQRIGRTGRKRDGRVVCLITKGAEERKLQQSERSTKTLFRALRPGGYNKFPFKKNEPLLPEHPVLTRQNMGIEKEYQMSQIGGHDKRAASKKKLKYHAQDFDQDDTWKLSPTQEIDRRKLFGSFNCKERFTIKSSIKFWQKSINNRSKLSHGYGYSCRVLRKLQLTFPTQKIEKAPVVGGGNIRTASEQKELINSPRNLPENITVNSISEDESVQNCYFPSDSDNEDNVVSTETFSSNGSNGKKLLNRLDAIFGTKKQRIVENKLPDVFQAIIFDDPTDIDYADSTKSSECFYSIYRRDEEALPCRDNRALSQSNKGGVETIMTGQDDVEMDGCQGNEGNEEYFVLEKDNDERKKLSTSESMELESQMGTCISSPAGHNNSESHTAKKVDEETADQKIDRGSTIFGENQNKQTNAGDSPRNGIELKEGNSNTKGRATDISQNVDSEKETISIENNIREKDDLLEVSNIEVSPKRDLEPSEEPPLPSFCFDLPSEKSSTSSSEDSDSDSGESRISFTIRLGGEGSTLNDGSVTNPPSNEHPGDNLLQEDYNTQPSPAKTINVNEQQKVEEIMNKSSLHNLTKSQESHETPLQLNQRKRKKLTIIDEMQDDISHDLTPTPNKTSRKSFALENLTDTPDQKTASSIQSLASPLNDLTDTPSSVKRKKEAKMDKLVRGKRRKMGNACCKYLELEAIDDLDAGGSAIESEEDDDMRPSQDSFINDSSQLGYSQSQYSSLEEEIGTSHRQVDTLNRQEDIFSTPILKTRHQQTQSSLPSSEKVIGKMPFIRSVMEHCKRGGDPNDIERGYNDLLSKADSTQSQNESVHSESAGIEVLSQKADNLHDESQSKSSQNMSSLTSEQKARIERNRQRALIIRRAKLKERAGLKQK